MAVYDFVSSGSDVESIKTSLDAEIENMTTSVDTITSTFQTMNGSWKGESYDSFMAENVNKYSENLTSILENLTAFSSALDSVSIDADNLYTTVESICNGIGSENDGE